MKIPEQSTFCTRCGEKIQISSRISNKMLILAFCAAAVSLGVAALSFFKDSLGNRADTVINGLSAPTAGVTPKASPTPTTPAVTVETAKPSPTPGEPLASPTSRTTIVSTTDLELPRRQLRSYPFVVEDNMQNPRISGKVTVEGGRDIEILVVDDEGLQEFSDSGLGRRIPNQYRARLSGTMNVLIPIKQPGTYYLILSNHHAILFTKTVKADLALEYQ
ncbi:MAG: hypothetical protein J2P41_22725 [Blastocatellia bacterium]|nr:hypothetical protein [Blastocatellia bacterium]